MAWDAAARESTPTPPDGDVHRPAFVNGNGPGARAGADEGTEQGAAAGVVHEAAQNATFVSGVRDTLVSMPGGAGRVLDGDNPAIKQEIIRMVAAYLEGEGYLSSAMTLMDEANVVGLPPKRLVCRVDIDPQNPDAYGRILPHPPLPPPYLKTGGGQVKREARKAEQQQRQKSKGVHKAILDGDWAEEFKDLCYLLTCKSIADVDKDWDGIASARARLAAVFTSLLADSEVFHPPLLAASVDKDWDGIAPRALARLAAVFTSLLADSEAAPLLFASHT
ncbi:hypothetical protein T484DRAFT_3640829 [Baffinella frigidus]|nr:hypothetical protein T484DRAFT_3640829 [Cryptophyta sp. CCMP2293]